jgi:ATP-dependent DNA ligase
MGAVMDRAKQLDGPDQSLEEAMNDFAGGAAVDGEEIKPQKLRRKVDCVIIGYQTDNDGILDMLVLATVNGKKLMSVGTVRPVMSSRELSDLLEMLRAIHRTDPFIAAGAEATWVEPQIACRISYGERLKGGKLRDLEWDTLLGTMRMPQ